VPSALDDFYAFLREHGRWMATLDWIALMRHPLLIALVQLFVGGGLAYLLTERWHRWRQRREFQYRVMSAFSQSSVRLFLLLTDQLINHPKRGEMSDAWDEKQRLIFEQRVLLRALRAEILASFSGAHVITAYFAMGDATTALTDMIDSRRPYNLQECEILLVEYKEQRSQALLRMMAAMKFRTAKNDETTYKVGMADKGD